MSAAKYSGIGARAASANSALSPAANACTNFMGSSATIMGRRRISVAPPSLCREDDEADFVPSAAKFFVAMPQLGRAYRPEDFQHHHHLAPPGRCPSPNSNPWRGFSFSLAPPELEGPGRQ